MTAVKILAWLVVLMLGGALAFLFAALIVWTMVYLAS